MAKVENDAVRKRRVPGIAVAARSRPNPNIIRDSPPYGRDDILSVDWACHQRRQHTIKPFVVNARCIPEPPRTAPDHLPADWRSAANTGRTRQLIAAATQHHRKPSRARTCKEVAAAESVLVLTRAFNGLRQIPAGRFRRLLRVSHIEYVLGGRHAIVYTRPHDESSVPEGDKLAEQLLAELVAAWPRLRAAPAG
jgi:hypothetical protein